MARIDFSLVLACYNEGPTFEKNISSIIKALKKITKTWEIIFVEDKSTDDTRKTLERISRRLKNSQTIFHTENLGRGKSVSDGILKSRGDICGYIDVDGEVSPEYIPIFIKEIEDGWDMAVGTRFYEKSAKSLSRVVSSKAYSFLVKTLLGLPFGDTESGYKFFRRKTILPTLRKTKDNHWFWDTEICALAHLDGLKISEIPVLFVRRFDKKSTVKVVGDSIYYLRKLIEFRSKMNKLKQ